MAFVTAISIIIGIFATLYGIRQNNERNRAENNLYTLTTQWQDERGRLVIETTELRYTVNELRQISKKDSSKLSEAEKKLLQARNVVDNMKIRLRKVESVDRITLESESGYTAPIVFKTRDTCLFEVKPIVTDNLELNFRQVNDSLIIDHHYKSDIDVVIDRDQGLNKKGKKRFFLCRWLKPDWIYSSNVVSDDPNAEITSNVYIKFQRGKGKRK